MSVQSAIKRKTAPDIRARKNGEPIVMLTSYHAHTAALVDRYCDVILVGDSLGNVMHGFETTVPVTLEMMILQGHAVMRGSQHALVVVDMPFGSYEASKEQAFHSAARILKETHCGAVKLGNSALAQSEQGGDLGEGDALVIVQLHDGPLGAGKLCDRRRHGCFKLTPDGAVISGGGVGKACLFGDEADGDARRQVRKGYDRVQLRVIAQGGQALLLLAAAVAVLGRAFT